MPSLKWLIKQLLPLTYFSKYKDGEDKQFVCSWKMFMGKPYNIEHFEVVK